MIDFINICDSFFDKFLFIFEGIGMLEFVFNDVDCVIGVVGVVFFIGMLVFLVIGIDDWGFLDIFFG